MWPARKLHEQVLAARWELLGPKHPHTLMTMGNLALALVIVGAGPIIFGQAREFDCSDIQACRAPP